MSTVKIIGAGPAGTASAIHLAKNGHRVRLLEKAKFPRPKLCGGFLSPECLEDLESLGVLDAVLAEGAIQIKRVVIVAPSGVTAESHLHQAGLSFSRQRLDQLLLDQARSVGVTVEEATEGLADSSNEEWTLYAYGRATEMHLPPGASFYGIQAMFEEVPQMTDQVEIDLIPDGYIGLVRQSERQVNICALVARERLRGDGPDLDRVIATWARLNPRLQRHLIAARRVSDWQAVGPVRMGLRQLAAGKKLWVGDAAYVVDPFMGEGITMAVRGAACVAKAFRQPDAVAAAYEQAWHEQFDAALRWSPWLRRIIRSSITQELAVRGMRLFPSLLASITAHTRTGSYA
jgi:menaquinone-9 beta-reductase